MEIVCLKELDEVSKLLRTFTGAPGNIRAARVDNALICHKDSVGAVVIKLDAPCTVFRLQEPRMVSAIEEYLHNLPDDAALGAESLLAELLPD